jgi:uroporphyrinogen-III synthase
VKLLIIRPQPGADASAARARSAGFEPVTVPFFEIRARRWTVPDPSQFDAMLVSSANAIRHGGPGLAALYSLPVHTVGLQSAAVASDAGMNVISTGESGVEAALAAAAAAGHDRLLWLAGEDRMKLAVPIGMQVDAMAIYASQPLELDEAAHDSIAECQLVALHSARAATAFAEYAEQHCTGRKRFMLAALSPAIAQAAGTGWSGIAIAASPEDRELLSAARALVRENADLKLQGDRH